MKKILALVFSLLFVFSFVGCGETKDGNTVTVAASSTPHALILEQCKAEMEAKGYKLEIKVMDDYVIPNTATESGEVDANYFQHGPYLTSFNASNGTHLVSVAKVHYEPYCIYAGTSTDLKSIPDGAKIAVPNDPSNEYRALKLLESQGLITLNSNVTTEATKNDIKDNPHGFEIVEMEAALLPGVRDEVAVAVINGNYAIAAGLNVSDALAIEDAASDAAQTYANLLVVKEGNEQSEKILALVEVLQSEKIKNYIADTFGGAVVAIH